MAGDKKINIHVNTTANTSGLEKAETGVQSLQRHSVRDIETITDKVKVSEFAFYNLDAEIRRTNTTASKFTQQTAGIKRGSSDAARSLLLFSQGFEDAQYGIRGVLNNIPQLVMSLGMGAGVAGAISIAAVAGSQLWSWFSKSEEKANELNDRMMEVAETMGSVQGDKLSKIEASIDARTDAMIALREQVEMTQEAESKAAVASLSNAEKIRQAQTNIAIVLGEQVDRYDELLAIEGEATAKRQLAEQQAIAAENKKAAAAKLALQEAETRLNDQLEKYDRERAELDRLTAAYKKFVAEKAALQKVAYAPLSLPVYGGYGADTAASMEAAQALSRRSKAQNELDVNYPDAVGKGLYNSLEATKQALEKFDGADGLIAKAQVKLVTASNRLQDVSAAVDTNIASIEAAFAAENLLARSAGAVDKSKEVAASVSEFIGGVETQSEFVRVAIREAAEIAASGSAVTEDEIPALNRNLRLITGALQAGLATTNRNQIEMLQVVRKLQADADGLSKAVAELQRQ